MLTCGLLFVGVAAFTKTLITFILVLGVLIFVHEFGHYIIAKWAGVRVEEFALGFGPKLIHFQKGETLYSLRVFPLGGFCKLTGEFPHAEEELEGEELAAYQEAVRDGRALYQKSVFQRFGVMFTGPLMNFVLAVVLFTVIFAIAGLPVAGSNEPVIGYIIPEYPADEAGLKANDRIISINGQEVTEWEDIPEIINSVETGRVTFEIEREGKISRIDVKPQINEQTGKREIGVYQVFINKKIGFFESIWNALLETWYLMKLIVVGFWQMITGQMAADVAGPVLIAKMVGEAAEVGWISLLRLTALISINLGIINLVPFPALDGGRILFLGVEMVRGKAVDPVKEGFVHFIGFVILMALIVIILYRDIVRIF